MSSLRRSGADPENRIRFRGDPPLPGLTVFTTIGEHDRPWGDEEKKVRRSEGPKVRPQDGEPPPWRSSSSRLSPRRHGGGSLRGPLVARPASTWAAWPPARVRPT